MFPFFSPITLLMIADSCHLIVDTELSLLFREFTLKVI